MPADFATILTPQYVQTARPSALLAGIRVWIEAAQPSSLIHPHGFLVLLLRRTDREEWRFHVWPQGMRLISGMPGPIHTHDKVVDSRVLKGELTNVVYSIAEAPAGGSPVYEVEYPSDKYDPQATNLLKRSSARVDASAIGEQFVPTGERYSVPAHVFHQAVVPESVCTCTIVHMHSPAPGPVKVIGIDGYPDAIGLRRVECSAADTLAAARI
jgi:hypothetical protein